MKTQMEQRGQELNSWDKLVEKAIDAKAKASLQPASLLRKLIAPLIVPWSNPKPPALETLGTSPPHLPKKLNRRTNLTFALPAFTFLALFAPTIFAILDGLRVQKEILEEKEGAAPPRAGKKLRTPPTNVNMAGMSGRARDCKELSHITYFNCDKTGHYGNKYPKARKDDDASSSEN